MKSIKASSWLSLTLLLGFTAVDLPAQSHVQVKQTGNQYQLMVEGKPFFVHGVGGNDYLPDLVAMGGNSIRTWGIEDLDKKVDGVPLMERAHKLGLMVTAGLWLQHPGSINYDDPDSVKRQRDAVLDGVRKHKNDPALLMWGLGNEMEGPLQDGSDLRVWDEVNSLAALVKQEDPNHPVMTVIAGTGGVRLKNIGSYCPNIDILGVNSYGGASGVGGALTAAGWTRPFILTEFGPVGDWEVPKTAWGAALEPTANQKAENYYASQVMVTGDNKNNCLGTYAFLWGNKQECTATWFGMYLKSGERLPAVDAMSYCWTGKWPEHRCPKIKSITSPLQTDTIAPGAMTQATVDAVELKGGALTYEWSVVDEATVLGVGGEAEAVQPTHPECLIGPPGPTMKLKAPTVPGPYRLFLTVRGYPGTASTANIPFLVK